jgi:hypothetical protein
MTDRPKLLTLRNAGTMLFVVLVNAVIVGILLQSFLWAE